MALNGLYQPRRASQISSLDVELRIADIYDKVEFE